MFKAFTRKKSKNVILGIEFDFNSDHTVKSDDIIPVVKKLGLLHKQEIEAYRFLVEEADRFSMGDEYEQHVLSLSGMSELEYSGESKKIEEFLNNRPGVDFISMLFSQVEKIKGAAFAKNMRGQVYLFYNTHHHALLKGIRLKWAVHYHNNCIENGHFNYAEKWARVIDTIEESKPLIFQPNTV